MGGNNSNYGMIVKKPWDDGTELVIDYDESHAVISTPPNEGEDRSTEITFQSTDGKVKKTLTINQEGKREPFGDFLASDGKFLVLKHK